MSSLVRYRSLLMGRNGIFASLVAASVCLALGLFVTERMGRLVEEVLVSNEKQNAVARLSEARAQIEGKVSETVALGESVRSYTALNPGLQQAEFSRISAALMEANESISVVGLAPDNVLRFVYPLEVNSKAIGLDYRDNAQQWPSVVKAMKTRSVVVSGPVNLVQGGRALVIRVPVFLADGDEGRIGSGPYWGVATLVVKEKEILDVAGLDNVRRDLNVAIVSSEAANDTLGLIYGDKDVLEDPSVEIPIELSGGATWRLVAHPRNGWSSGKKEAWLTRAIGLAVSLLFALMAFLIVYEIGKVWAMALHDPLTGLANRRLLEERMRQLALMHGRSGQGFYIFYVDLDGFKPINDNYGHLVGDQVLMTVGDRLKHHVRTSDTVARVGGDEFVVLAAGTMSQDERQQFHQRLELALTRPLDANCTEITMTASIGSAGYPEDAVSVEDLIKLADARMYTRKHKRSSADAPDASEPVTSVILTASRS